MIIYYYWECDVNILATDKKRSQLNMHKANVPQELVKAHKKAWKTYEQAELKLANAIARSKCLKN